MTMTRYDQRKNHEEAEANAIGSEYVRADLTPCGGRESAFAVKDLCRAAPFVLSGNG